MKTHKIDLEGLIDWRTEEKVLFASSSRENKKLFCTLRGVYEVYHKKEKVLETFEAIKAVEMYNSINQ